MSLIILGEKGGGIKVRGSRREWGLIVIGLRPQIRTIVVEERK